MIHGKNFFNQSVKIKSRTYDSTWKIVIGQGDDRTTCCLLNYNYFNDYYKMITIDLSKQQALDADPKAMQRSNFTVNLDMEIKIQQAHLSFKGSP